MKKYSGFPYKKASAVALCLALTTRVDAHSNPRSIVIDNNPVPINKMIINADKLPGGLTTARRLNSRTMVTYAKTQGVGGTHPQANNKQQWGPGFQKLCPGGQLVMPDDGSIRCVTKKGSTVIVPPGP